MADLTQTRAMEYFNYDPATGDMIYKRRPDHEFTPMTLARHKKRVGTVAGCANSDGYIKIFIDGQYYRAHRVAWLIVQGEMPKYPKFEIDHINGNRADNRFCNLRKVTKSGNQRNAGGRVNNSSGVHGVNWKKRGDGGRWVARIWNGPRHVYLGQFPTLHEASIARKAAERALGYTGTERGPDQRKIDALIAANDPSVEDLKGWVSE